MHETNLLTIVLTLKGRHSYTWRWLNWASSQNCEYKILIADGSEDNSIELSLNTMNEYKNLNIEYFKYPYDSELHIYFKKLDLIIQKVESKYCILADNDDFILFDNLKEAIIKFEKGNDISVYCRPQLRINFDHIDSDIEKHLYPIKNIKLRKINFEKKFEILKSSSQLDKLKFTISHFEASLIWYGIHKTDNLQRIFSKVRHNNYSLQMMLEWYLYYSSSLFGGCIIEEGKPFVVRQEMTSTGAASLVKSERLDRIFLNQTWSRDLHILINDLYKDSKLEQSNYSYLEFEQFFKNHFHAYLLSWNKFQYFADKFKNKNYYEFLTYLKHLILSFLGKNNKYRNIDYYTEDLEILKLKHFLLNK